MTADIIFGLVLGHLLADFGLQPKKMALLKNTPGWKGCGICTLHSLIYTICVSFFLWKFDPVFLLLIFFSHYVVDRYSLANKWLALIKGRTFLGAYESKDQYREFDISFTCIVYEKTDLMIHLLLMYPIFHFF